MSAKTIDFIDMDWQLLVFALEVVPDEGRRENIFLVPSLFQNDRKCTLRISRLTYGVVDIISKLKVIF